MAELDAQDFNNEMNEMSTPHPRILVLGAGGTGGYFGGRLAQVNLDVTFLVRAPRALQLQQNGLIIRSPLGDARFPVQHVTAYALPALADTRPFDVVIVSCKAYDLDSAINAIAPAVAPDTTVLPILNGLRHYPALDARFGRDAVLGGLCFINAAKAEDGAIIHLGGHARMTFGERDVDERAAGESSARVRAFAAACSAAGIDHVASSNIAQEQWIKYTFLATLAAGTCLMRADVGTIAATDHGSGFMRALYAETLAIAAAEGQPIPPAAQNEALAILTKPASRNTASMLRDLNAGQRVEAEHILGDLIERAAAAQLDVPLLQTGHCHLQAYQLRRQAE